MGWRDLQVVVVMNIQVNNKGLSMVEMLAATATAAIVLFAIFSVHTYMMKSQMSSMNSMDGVDLRFEVAAIMAEEDKCSAILEGKHSVAGELIAISPTLGADKDWAGGRMHISSIQLQSIKNLGSAGKVNAKLMIAGTRLGSNRKVDFIEYIPIYYSVNASNVITTCHDDFQVCSYMGGIWNANHCDFCTNLGGKLRPDGTCGAGI
ncbi:hypothetical protein [Bdellovibrio svalbardensis]|uniref:Prepilin-type N-terminal cleavage/methylation domain-containing protein n=1 Tax=Bdellovibrio svalbardensis TaxID=2972972 RepID=A0ABT6DGV7_9BACT|nr:hypothetical protein [Bdellovibrio svalbardensis]MDG0816101.1 hypothetical protein [Bdellovibrio svalbardensis]